MAETDPADHRFDPAAERRLAERAAAGDRRAAEELLGALYDQVFAICRRICTRPEDGEDATQEAMISIARSLPSFDGRSTVRTWTYRIATNAALDELRRRNRRPEPVDTHHDQRLAMRPTPGARVDPDRSGPMDAAVADRLDIDAALRRLAPEFRVAVVLRDLIGMEYSEIAETTAVPVGTVRSRIARGRAQLRVSLGPGNRTGDSDVEPGES